jgi:hypothetical protein
MRTVGEYFAKADEFQALADAAFDKSLQRRYADLADRYRLLAKERERLLAEGTIQPDITGPA